MSEPPNIVIISCHDIGQHLGCYGVETVCTPSIDRLAAEGVRFERSFATAPQCSPSRSSIYTGRYPHSNGVMGLCHANFAWDLHPTERHLASILAEGGYHTALVGVQHETPHPERMGYHDIIPGGLCDKVAPKAVEYIRQVAAHNQPFYAQIGFAEPHRDFDAGGAKPDASKGVTIPPYIVDEPSAREEFAAFQGAIRKVDSRIGRVLDALDETGLSENTITIYTADHGIPFPRAKCSLYDPGLQVPFIVRWPGGGWTGGKVYGEMISNIDYVPTLLEAAGIPVADNVHGRSFLGLLDGTGYEPRGEIFAEITYHDYYDPRRSIRTETHKLIAGFSATLALMDPTQSWRPATTPKVPDDPARHRHPHIELYDLVKDPLEFEDVADDPAYAGVRKQLAGRLLDWMAATGDPLLAGVPVSPMHEKTLAMLKETR